MDDPAADLDDRWRTKTGRQWHLSTIPERCPTKHAGVAQLSYRRSLMRLADWIRASIWPHPDWRAALRELCDRVSHESAPPATRASDLADACELIDPDRRYALGMHQLAWQRGGNVEALARSYEVAREIGDHEALATLGLTAYDVTHDASHLVTAGLAFLDGWLPARAEMALAKAAETHPKDDELKSLLGMLRQEIRDPQAEISSWIARATRASGAESGKLYLQAARLARLAGLDPIFSRHLETAFQRGRDASTSMLIEADLMKRRRANDLLAFYRGRVESAGSDREWADLMRAAGTKLVLANVQRGLALRMLRSGLEAAYRANLADIPGHLASWDLLIRHAREARSTRELMPLVVEAMSQPLSDDARLFLARFGFDVTWREAHDREAARPNPAANAEHLPADVDLHDFVAPSQPAPPPAPAVRAQTAYEPSTAPLPPEQTVIRMKPKAAPPPLAAEAITELRSGNRKPGLPTSPPIPAQAARIAERVVVPADIEVRVGTETFSALVRDLSTTGVYVVTEHEIPINALVTIAIELPAPGVLDVTRYEAAAKVVRRAYTGYGMVLLAPPAALVAAIAALGTR
jgi:hypothetical protein